MNYFVRFFVCKYCQTIKIKKLGYKFTIDTAFFSNRILYTVKNRTEITDFKPFIRVITIYLL